MGIYMSESGHEFYLMKALDLAEQRRGFCSPNPSVGAVIVGRDGKTLAQGYHQGPGHSHAEVDALKKTQEIPKNATMYVTLEPCCHWGRTPPCTEAIIQAGIKHVVYGYRDPNPLVLGKGVVQLSEAGIFCEYVLLSEIARFYQSYEYWHYHKRPFVTAKLAISLNGKTAGHNGQRIQITGEELQYETYRFRNRSDAILTTARTIIFDDPQLNVRYDTGVTSKPLYILDRNLSVPLEANVFTTAKSVSLFHSQYCDKINIQKFKNIGVNCISVDETPEGLDLEQVLLKIGRDGVHDLWVETGGKLFESLLKKKLIHRGLIYVAPKWLDHGQPAFDDHFSFEIHKKNIKWQPYGGDVLGEFTFCTDF